MYTDDDIPHTDYDIPYVYLIFVYSVYSYW